MEPAFSASTWSRIYRISSRIVDILRTKIPNAWDRARVISIFHELSREDDGAWTYLPMKGIKNYLRERIVPNHKQLNTILDVMKTLGLICLDNTEKNHFGTVVSNMQIELQFQDSSFYTFTENHSETKYLKKIVPKTQKVMESRWNDGQITLPQDVLDTLDPDFDNVSEDFKALMQKRILGEDVKSVVSRAKCGRFFGTFSTLPSHIRDLLIDNNTGNRLACIDNKASQISFLVAYLRNNTKRSAKDSMKSELDKLEQIQTSSSFHDFLTSSINSKSHTSKEEEERDTPYMCDISRNAIKKLVMKLLFGDWRWHDNAELFSKTISKTDKVKFFSKEVVEHFENNGWDILDVWIECVNCFKENFQSIYCYMIGIMNRKEKNSVADITQKLEGDWMKGLQEKLKVLVNAKKRAGIDLQFFTLHDAVYFSPEHFQEVRQVFMDHNKEWEQYHGLKVNRMLKMPPAFRSSIALSENFILGTFVV